MRFSILTPSLNSALYLERAIDSVLSQDREAEHIVFDGGSSDGTVEILRKRGDRLAFWTSEKDEGQADALNKALARATGDIVGWLNADEFYEPNILGFVESVFARDRNIALVYGSWKLVLDTGAVIRTNHPCRFDYHVCMFNAPIILNCAAFFKKDRLVECGGFDKTYRFMMDGELYVRYMRGHPAWERVNRVLANFTLHRLSKTSTMQAVLADEIWRMRRREFPHYTDDDFTRECRKAMRRMKWLLLTDGRLFEKIYFNLFRRSKYQLYFGDNGPRIPAVSSFLDWIFRG